MLFNDDEMTRVIEGDKPDYLAMAAILEQVAQELRSQGSVKSKSKEHDQADRLERIAAEIKAGSAREVN